MKILLTGATGYIGKRLLPILVQLGHEVVCAVRDPNRFKVHSNIKDQVQVVKIDFLDDKSLKNIPADIDGAYYLMHSMTGESNFKELETKVAENFVQALKGTNVQHVIYLTGIINENDLSEHLSSRKAVEDILGAQQFNFTALRAGIIIGSGSASFEIIRDLVEKLPIMITPKWLNTKSQPIGISDVIKFLSLSLFSTKTYNKNFDIGSPDVLTYKEILLGYAAVRGLKRWIVTVPIMTPKISSYWLYFITSTSFKLASALVDSMKIEVICKNHELNEILSIQPVNYQQALEMTLDTIEGGQIISSWKDSFISSRMDNSLNDYVTAPNFGSFKDERKRIMQNKKNTFMKIWAIGGDTGWYYANWLWRIRGFLDKLSGGVGLRRGRTSPSIISTGDVIDFWRVVDADNDRFRLLLFAEMKLPGEAWLEFKVVGNELHQIATFRPKGLIGRIYWYSVYPFHGFIFDGMLKRLTSD